MKWFKFYGQDWMTDPKIAGLRMEDRLCFLTLLCIASGEGKDGVIKSLDEDVLISMAQIPSWLINDYNPEENARGVLGRLEALQIVTLSGNASGNTDVTLRNYSARQEQNSSNAEKQRLYRERLKQKVKESVYVTVTDGNARGNVLHRVDKSRVDKKRNINTYITAEADDAFEVLWKSYPRKVGKGAARKAWDKAKGKPPVEKILKALEEQKKSPQWRKDNGQFIPHPSTWINQQRWDDEVDGEITSNKIIKL